MTFFKWCPPLPKFLATSLTVRYPVCRTAQYKNWPNVQYSKIEKLTPSASSNFRTSRVVLFTKKLENFDVNFERSRFWEMVTQKMFVFLKKVYFLPKYKLLDLI